MSRESLLDEAIAKAKECEDWQLVEWLRMARGGESAARWYSKKLQAEQDENDRLREEVRHLKKGDVLHVLTDQEFAEQQKHEREMQASVKALDDENEKLRELVRDMHLWFVRGHDWGPYCAGEKVSIEDCMRELGVEP